MALPSTGWLDTNPDTEEVLPAVLPVLFEGNYIVGTDSFESITDPDTKPSAISIKFGDCAATIDHGVSEDAEYGLIVNIIRKGAFGSIVLDSLTIPEVAIDKLVKEVCPEPFDKVVETCPETTVESLESKPPALDDTEENVLPAIELESVDLPCGVIQPILFNGIYKFDGSWQIL